MRVEELIIDGFKSYAARTVISGWDEQFNAITGLNGSGKSNILDAICFVLGIASMSVVRASNLQDLIYKRGQAGVTKASVTIVFENSDKSKSPFGFENTPQISVTRQVALGGTSKYLINGRKAQQQVVLQLFQSIQLNINNPNFLIMQGKITKVLNMKPAEILSLIEEASGTKMFEDRRQKAEKTMAKKDVKLVEIGAILKEEIEPKLEKLRSEKRFFLEYQDTQTDLERLTRVVSAHRYQQVSAKYQKLVDSLSNREQNSTVLKTQCETLAVEIGSLEEDLQETLRKKQSELSNSGQFKDLEVRETTLNNDISRLLTQRDLKAENLKEEQIKQQQMETQVQQFHRTLQSGKGGLDALKSAHSATELELDECKKLHKSKEELLSTLSTGLSSSGSTESGYTGQLQNARKQLSDSGVKVKQSQLQISHLQKEIASNKARVKSAQSEIEELMHNKESQKQTCQALHDKLGKIGFDPDRFKSLKQERALVSKDLQNARRDAEGLKRNLSRLDFSYSKPSPNFNDSSVKGVAAQLFSVSDESLDYASALEVAAGGRLYFVVVDTDVTGSQLLDKGQLKKRVSIIPLNKISVRNLDPRVVDLAKELCPGNVEAAIDLVEYDSEVAKAMQFVFGGKFVCRDGDTAEKIAFHPKIRTMCVTVDGDTYEPGGRLSGGARRSKSSMLVAIQRFNKVNQKVKVLQSKLQNIDQELNELSALSEQTKSLQQEYNVAQHQLSIIERSLESNQAATLLKKQQASQEEIESLKESVKEEEAQMSQIEKQINDIEKDMKEFNSNKGQKLEELKSEISGLAKNIAKLEDILETKFSDYQSAQYESDQVVDDLAALTKSVEESKLSITELQSQIHDLEASIAELQAQLSTVSDRLQAERAKMASIDEEVHDIKSVLDRKTKESNAKKLELQKLTNDLEKYVSVRDSLKKQLQTLIEDNEWVADENEVASVLKETPDIDLEECEARISKLEDRFQGMRRKVNTNIMSMIENVEKKELSLKNMIKTIEKDKSKIEETLTKLNEYKRTTLVETWHKVSTEFGQIFGDLLPQAFAKLEPPEGMDVSQGLEVKVKLGKVWKESLVELSGGQRSLIALSLILALLQFKPAPMYILDEVDAALDPSHTQNIGHLIKTRFKGSQFIIVSLKDGMFSNANRIFRTRFQDGTSMVTTLK
ncbi:unnamed protein product [Kuraishia capsulata CBS 1993]|uniref:Structural maintenance of chromosomes protein n=1 Tax=Kuraishia capsulata CBS 1993 TaxID=1382522 RepID=W6MRU8_9ASCO|nr:uncharacterized protein KUCA_T00003947001 [Kuraishia capsulata CBS 1993]CDK27967.1 unnamed protein product [Kuraishia capsulata CBS 1993]